MNLSLIDFCILVKTLDKNNAEKAMAVLWYHDHMEPGIAMTSRQLARVLHDHNVGAPNPTWLQQAVRRTRLANEAKRGFSLKPASRKTIRDWLPRDIHGLQPAIDHSAGYLPEAVWIGTRGYVESICRQLNGCFNAAYYDAAAVMLRRLLETLLIEAYEHLKRESEIKDVGGTGNYLMLKELVERACAEKGHSGLNLGRDCRATLREARDVGNWSAHARRYNAVAADLVNLRAGARVAVQELIQVADLKKVRT